MGNRPSHTLRPTDRRTQTKGHVAIFIVMLTYQRPLSEIDALMRRYVAWLKRDYESGLSIASGWRVPRVGGTILARSGDAAALEAAMQEDLFVKQGAAPFDDRVHSKHDGALGRGVKALEAPRAARRIRV